MKTILAMILFAGIWYTTSLRAENEVPPDQAEKTETGVAEVAPSPRSMTYEVHQDLITVLSTESGNRVWFVTQPNDPEAESFEHEIEDAFLQSGWKIADSSKSPRPLRAGLRVFVADVELPDHVSVAVTGLRDSGFEVFTGNGYRAFYDRAKEKNPDFTGVELAPDQDFVIVVGPNPSVP